MTATAVRVTKLQIVMIVWGWILLLQVTHLADASPYSYEWALFDRPSARLSGAVVNPDAIPIARATQFFYDGTPPDWPTVEAQNLRFPLHSFASATVAGIVRSRLLAAFAVNFLFAALLALAAVNLAERHSLHRMATLVALLTVFALPMFVDYLGQPLHYIVGIAQSGLVILALLALPSAERIRPAVAASAVALLALSYDPYVFVASVVTFVAWQHRRARASLLTFLAAGFAPVVAWAAFLRVASDGTFTSHLRTWFVIPVLSAWLDFFLAPLERAAQPFVASHVGVHVALHQLIAMIPWPLLVAAVAMLAMSPPRIDATRGSFLLLLLPLFFLVEQMVVAGWDWELNPRRAIPAVVAFAATYVCGASQRWESRWWRRGLVALLAFTALLAFADTLFRTPVISFLRTMQAIRHEPQDPVELLERKLDPASMPALMRDETVVWHDLPRARIDRSQAWLFVVSQAAGLALLVALLHFVARAGLLPRWIVPTAGAVWIASLARFI